MYFNDHTQTSNFEAGLYENDPNKRFDIIFGTIQPGSDQLYVSGVQGPNNIFTQDFCFAGPPSPGSIPEQSTLIRFQAYQHYHTSSNEKEIRFSIRLL